jgi:hypothetical protein
MPVARASNATVLAAENHIRGVLKSAAITIGWPLVRATTVCITHCKLCPAAEHLGQRGHASRAGCDVRPSSVESPGPARRSNLQTGTGAAT